MALELAQIVAKLVEPIGMGRESKAGQQRLMQLAAGGSAYGMSSMEQHLE